MKEEWEVWYDLSPEKPVFTEVERIAEIGLMANGDVIRMSISPDGVRQAVEGLNAGFERVRLAADDLREGFATLAQGIREAIGGATYLGFGRREGE